MIGSGGTSRDGGGRGMLLETIPGGLDAGMTSIKSWSLRSSFERMIHPFAPRVVSVYEAKRRGEALFRGNAGPVYQAKALFCLLADSMKSEWGSIFSPSSTPAGWAPVGGDLDPKISLCPDEGTLDCC
jgi:hypothetical protein